MKVKLKLALALGCSLMAAQYASQAALSQMSVGYYNNYLVGVSAQGYGHSTYATAFSADRTGGDPLPTGHTDPFVSFCLDINTILGNGWWQSAGFSQVPATGTVGDPENPTGPAVRNVASGLNSAANLYAHYAGNVGHASGDGHTITWVNKAEGAALQLAIWEVLYETTKVGGNYVYDVTSGSGFNVTSGGNAIYSGTTTIADRANQMLAAYGAPDYNIDTTFWNAVNQDGTFRSSQDLIGPMTPVPEPTTIVAGALLLLPFGASTMRVLRRRRI